MEQEAPQGRTNMKSVGMPPAEETLTILRRAGLLGVSPEFDGFFEKFAGLISDSQMTGIDLNRKWEKAKIEKLSNNPPIDRIAIDSFYTLSIRAITPDPEVAGQAVNFRNEMLGIEENSQWVQSIPLLTSKPI